MKSVSLHPYQLTPVSSGGQARLGALLRIEFKENAQVGFADCHPWPELGDLSLAGQLELLSRGRLTPLTERSVALARIDSEARSAGRWLFEGVDVPRSHFTYAGRVSAGDFEARCEQVRVIGFKEIKLKVGYEPHEESRVLRGASALLLELGMKLRLDFNERLDIGEVGEFLDHARASSEWVDWLEDPTPYDVKSWAELRRSRGIRLALDRPLTIGAGRAGHEADSFDILVAKPAALDPAPIARLAIELGKELVVTSYLDHPLGTAAAAWTAAQLGVNTAGLLTHGTYEPNDFSACLGVSKDGRLIPPRGTGFGWDRELAQLSWERA